MQKTLKSIILGTCLALSPFLPTSKASAAQEFVRGDVDGNGKITLTDPINTLNYLFKGGAKPECEDAMDVNDDGKVDLGDAVYSLGYLFKGGSVPERPFPEKGYDLKRDDLGCKGEGDLGGFFEIRQSDIPLIITSGGTQRDPAVYLLLEDIVAKETAISVLGAHYVNLDGNGQTITIIGGDAGISFDNSHGSILKNTHIVSQRESEDKNALVSLKLNDFYEGIVTNNIFESEGDNLPAVLITSSKRNHFDYNQIKTLGTGSPAVLVSLSSNNFFKENQIETFEENSHGFESIGSQSYLLRNSITTEGRDSSGIFFSRYFDAFSKYNELANNNIITFGENAPGIFLSSSSHNLFYQDSVETRGQKSHGIEFMLGGLTSTSSTQNKFEFVRIYAYGSESYGLDFKLGNHEDNVLSDSEIGGEKSDVHFSRGGSLKLNNVLLSKEKLDFDPMSEAKVYRSWYLAATVSDLTGPLENALVKLYDSKGSLLPSQITGIDGNIPRQNLISYTQDKNGIVTVSPYRIKIEKEKYVSQEKTFDFTNNMNLEFVLEGEE